MGWENSISRRMRYCFACFRKQPFPTLDRRLLHPNNLETRARPGRRDRGLQRALLVCGAALIRFNCVQRLGGFDPEIRLGEDVDFFGRAMR